mgnify:CR=1 FL=1
MVKIKKIYGKGGKKIQNNKGKRIASMMLTIIFLITFILGELGIYPFGIYTSTGGWDKIITTKFTPVVTIPIYPLILLSNSLDKINLPEGKIELFYLVIAGVVIIIYYYFLSRVIIYFYTKIARKIKMKIQRIFNHVNLRGKFP